MQPQNLPYERHWPLVQTTAIRVNAQPTDGLFVAKQLAEVVKTEGMI